VNKEVIKREIEMNRIREHADYVRRQATRLGADDPSVKASAGFTLLMIADFKEKWSK